MLITVKLFCQISQFTPKLILLNHKQGVYIWAWGYLSVPVTTNVASKKILFDTAVIDLTKFDYFEIMFRSFRLLELTELIIDNLLLQLTINS